MKTSFTRSALTTSLLLLSSLAVHVHSTPVAPAQSNMIRLSMTKRFNFTGSKGILDRNQMRVRNLRTRVAARLSGESLSPNIGQTSVRAQNQAVAYVVNVGIGTGTPITTYELVVDISSANTWVGAGKTFIHSPTTRQTRDSVTVQLDRGFMTGVELTDTVTLSSDLTISGQSIGVASDAILVGFDGVDGILGIGPVELSVGTLKPDSTSSIATITDNLFSQGVITQDVVAISFEPTQSATILNSGELTFGGTDPSKFVGAITFAPITHANPSSEFFGIDQTIRYGISTRLLTNAPGIIDTTTTIVLLATDALRTYVDAVGGAILDRATGLYSISPTQFTNLQSLFFTINGVVFEFSANAQIWPRALNTVIGGDEDSIYLIVNDLGTLSGEGLDFILGMAFLERFYTVFDTENNRVGVANTQFTRATTN